MLKKIGLLGIVLMLTTSIAFASYVQAPAPVSKGGTGSTSQSASMAVTTDSIGHIVSTSSTTAAEIGYVHGVTSAIQTQFSGKASLALDNLASVALNTHLLPGSSGAVNLGSQALLFGDAYMTLIKDASGVKAIDPLNRSFWNASGVKLLDFSGSYAAMPVVGLLGSSSGNLQLKVPATVTSYSVTLPAAQGSSGQYMVNDGSGNMTWTSPASGNWTVVNGGDAAYSILAGDQHVRSGTALTATRTYTLPTCTSSNIGERHEVKNLASQSYALSVAANGSDNVDGSANYSLNPGDSVQIICAAFATNGTWDIE